jgi:hypothetical protein
MSMLYKFQNKRNIYALKRGLAFAAGVGASVIIHLLYINDFNFLQLTVLDSIVQIVFSLFLSFIFAYYGASKYWDKNFSDR